MSEPVNRDVLRVGKWDHVLALMGNLDAAWEAAIRACGPVRIEVSPYMAALLKDALQHWMDNEMPLYRGFVDLENWLNKAGEIAADMVHEQIVQHAFMLSDLESLLERLGREPQKPEEIHKVVTTIGGKPRSKSSIKVSEELARSVRERRIGKPRDPGQEG